MAKTLRVIDTGLAHPQYTGALDEALLKARSLDKVPDTLHFYGRNPPGVSLGYFGKAREEVDLDYLKKNGIVLLRRLSGGSAIYTDRRQLVYALASKDLLPSKPNEAYEEVCGALVRAFKQMGVPADFKPINDVQFEGRKLSGSALTRRWGAQLVHGTVLVEVDRERMFRALRVSEEKLRKKGLNDPGERVVSLSEIMGTPPSLDRVRKALLKGFESQFRMKAKSGKLTLFEEELVEKLVAGKYGTDEWNLRR